MYDKEVAQENFSPEQLRIVVAIVESSMDRELKINGILNVKYPWWNELREFEKQEITEKTLKAFLTNFKLTEKEVIHAFKLHSDLFCLNEKDRSNV